MARDERGAGTGSPAESVVRDVRAQYERASWFEIARATSVAHQALGTEPHRSALHDLLDARYHALRDLLDETTANLSTHSLHARL